MGKPVTIDDSNFDQMVLKSDKPVLVDFWAAWCRPCMMLSPTVDALAEEYAGAVSFYKLDIDHNPKTPTRFGVRSIPTLLIFKDGQPVANVVGLRSKQDLKRTLDAAIDVEKE